jgi:glycosyltransferase involved in cell wall biosynthesis
MPPDLVQKLTLIFVVTEDWYFWSHRLALARAARDDGYRVVVATRVRDHGDRIRAEGFDLVALPWRRSGDGVLGHVRAIAALVRLYRRERPNLVHHVALKGVVFGALAARIAGIGAEVNALTGLGYVFIGSDWRARLIGRPLRSVLRWLIDRPGSVVIVQNGDDRRALIDQVGVTAGRLVLIPGSGVDAMLYRPTPEPTGTPIVAAMVSRVLRDKGVVEFAEAGRLLALRGCPVHLNLIGPLDPDNPTGLSAEEIAGLVKSAGVTWQGATDDIAQIWADAHIAVLPSYREGLPKSLLEAAACGRPIVATDVPGCRDIARQGVNAILVPARDAAALADAIEALAVDPARRAAYGAAGRTLIEDVFAEPRIIAATLGCYRELLKHPARA